MAIEVAPGLQELQSKVLEKGLCSYCGACAGLCPYLRPFQGRIAVMDACLVAESRCVAFCPRTGLDMDEASQAVLGVPYNGEPIGEVRRVLIARSRDPQVLARAQYGGTVTALVSLALRRAIIKKAVLTRSEKGVPRGVVASSPEEVLACSGSTYLASPTLEAFNRLPSGPEPLGVVGTPCQLQALAKMRTSPLAGRSNAGRLALTIGLFCTWALSHTFLSELSRVAPTEEVRKTDVPPPPARVFDVYTRDGKVSLPLDEVRAHIPDACTLCPDMTAELADLSVGAAEGIEGWNTILIRSERGEALVDAAVEEGLLEVGSLPQPSLDHLVEASQNKKRGALERISQRTGSQEDMLFLRLRPELVRQALGS